MALLMDASAMSVRVTEPAKAVDEGCQPTDTSASRRRAPIDLRSAFIDGAAYRAHSIASRHCCGYSKPITVGVVHRSAQSMCAQIGRHNGTTVLAAGTG